MKNRVLFLFFLFLATLTQAQITFEKGYYIDNLNQRVEGFIKNQDWKNNPTSFEFKATENALPETITLKYAQEFGFRESAKYVRETVSVERSSSSLNSLSLERTPEFSEEELFLKVLVEGDANLYRYEEGNLTRYFYSRKNTPIKPLVFKKYMGQQQHLLENEEYKQELYNNLKCSSISLKTVEKLNYKGQELERFFTKYNTCIEPNFSNTIVKTKREFFHLNLRPGLKFAQLDIKRYSSLGFPARIIALDNEINFRAGLEAEFILPFNKDKWAIIAEPTYQSYESQAVVDNETTTVSYKSIELPLGVRHYFFLSSSSKLFVNAAIVIDFPLENSVINFRDRVELDMKSGNSPALGAGFKYADRYSIELRYELNRDILNDYLFYDSKYGGFSVIFGYTLF